MEGKKKMKITSENLSKSFSPTKKIKERYSENNERKFLKLLKTSNEEI